MKELTLEEIQKIELDILLNFARFCKKHNLRFYLCGGSLLGAVRHQGFIPWDDDVDVCMPRPDYDKFLNSFPKNDQVIQIADVKFGNMVAPFTKLKRIDTRTDSRTTEGEMNTKIWIDIFPVDGLPSSPNEQKILYRRAHFLRMLFYFNIEKFQFSRTLVRTFAKVFVRLFARTIGPRFFCNLLIKLGREHSYEKSDYVGCLTWGLYGFPAEVMKKQEFEKIEYLQFCGYKMPVFSCWEKYLKACYGDYMKLPKKEDRRTHHFKAYQL